MHIDVIISGNIRVQIFHTLYHTDENVLLGAPTGSGKTISAELAILHAFTAHPDRKIVYIAPMKVRAHLRTNFCNHIMSFGMEYSLV